MSVEETRVESVPGFETTDTPAYRSASYLGCRFCEEGSLVYDPEIGGSRCRTCGEVD